MKKNFDLLEVIKEAVKEGVLEAFAQMYGVNTLEETEDEAHKDNEGKEDKNDKGDKKKGSNLT